LENQQRRLLQQQERQQAEHAELAGSCAADSSKRSRTRGARGAMPGQRRRRRTAGAAHGITETRERERDQSKALNELRSRWQAALSTQVSTEALQQAALGKAAGKVTQWLKAQSLDERPRLAQQLRVDRGWERAVETVLGSYLEAVCVDGLDSVAELLGSFDGGQLAIVSTGEAPRQRGRGFAAGQSAGRAGLGVAAVVGVCGRDLGRGAGTPHEPARR
jgi:chromosome segregation protein